MPKIAWGAATLMSESVLSIVLTGFMNLVINSLAEELFLVAFSLVLLKRFDLLKPEKSNIIKISVPVVISAALSNVLRYTSVNIDLVSLICPFVMYVFMLLVYKVTSVKQALKFLICTIISLMMLLIAEMTYIPMVVYLTGKELTEYNHSIYLNFLLALPRGVILYTILFYILIKKESLVNINVLKVIVKSKSIAAVTVFVLLFNMVFLFIMWKLITYDKILVHLSSATQIVVIIASILFPIFNVIALWCMIFGLKSKEVYEKTLSKERLNQLADILKVYAQNGMYDKIDLVLEDLKNNINNKM